MGVRVAGYPFRHGLRRATFPKGTALGGAGKFAATAKAPPWGSWLCAAKTEGVKPEGVTKNLPLAGEAA